MVQALVCPLCRGEVAVASSGCLPCHLPMRDVVRHQPKRPASRGRDLAHALWVRLTGLVLYAAAVAWCAYQFPTAIPFVVPAAVLGGGVLHVWRGRPWTGLLVFAFVVVVVPLLVLPAVGVGTYTNLTQLF